MKNNSFILVFLVTFLGLTIIFASLLIIVDPKQTVELRKNNPFELYHENFILNKRQQMQKGDKDFDTLILGSSTSEAFYPADVNFYLDAKSFSASIGGGRTPTRFAFLQAAIEDFPSLTRVIYIVDFFEFNHNLPSGDFLYNSEFERLSAPLKLKRSSLAYLRYHFSNQFLESTLNVIKRKKNNIRTIIHPDGTTSLSMILSPLAEDISEEFDLSAEQKKNLMIQVDENFYTISTQVLNNFNELNPEVVEIFTMINSLASNLDLEVIYILSPYQYELKSKLMTLKNIPRLMNEFRSLFRYFAHKHKNIKVIDKLDESLANNPNSSSWRDGIHFSRNAASKMLKDIAH